MLKITYSTIRVFCFSIGILIALYLNFMLAAPVVHYIPLALSSLVGVGVLANGIIEEFRRSNNGL